MNKYTNELKRLADHLRQEVDRMAIDVREGGKASQEGFEKVLMAVHRVRNFLSTVPDKLNRIAKDLSHD